VGGAPQDPLRPHALVCGGRPRDRPAARHARGGARLRHQPGGARDPLSPRRPGRRRARRVSLGDRGQAGPARARAPALAILDWLPLVRYGRRLRALDGARRARVLSLLQRAPSLLIRRGFWGVRTLVLLAYYGRPAAAAAIGYRADPRGWDARERADGA